MDHRYNALPFFNSEFKFLLMHKSNFHVTGFSYGSNTCDVVGRVLHSREDFDMATATTSSWILAANASRWILAATASNWASRQEFQHSSPTFVPAILDATMGTSSWRASPTVGNASLDDTDAAVTFFFTTDGKTYSCLSIVTFVIRANVERFANSSIYVFKQPSSSVGRDFTDAVLNMGGSDEGNGSGNRNNAAS
jgi:hypothetical protein